MKKLFLGFACIAGMVTAGFSQETSLYTFFVNVVSEEYSLPLLGFVNIAKGDHDIAQAGFVNWNTKNFDGLQGGFVNTAGGNLAGAQVGYVNTTSGCVYGWQHGFVNTAGSVRGVQTGMVNTAINGGQGFQLGIVNTSMKKLQGIQLGLFNYVDSIEDGVPVGLVSIVRHGGYHAVEYSFSEFHPVNIGLKLGIDKFYTSIIAAYNPTDEASWDNFAMGIGIGSLFPINNLLFINPELNYLNACWDRDDDGWGKRRRKDRHDWRDNDDCDEYVDNTRHLLSFVPWFGFNITKNISIAAAPSFTWVHCGDDKELQKPVFKMFDHEINDNNSIVIGARASVKLRF